MISDHFWKILFLLFVLTGVGFWYKNYAEKRAFSSLATELAELISFSEDTMPENAAEAQARFLKALALIHTAKADGNNGGLLLDAAFKYNDLGLDGPRANLIRSAIVDSERHAEEFGIFTPELIWDLQNGEAVTIAEGPFAGDKITLILHVPASIAPQGEFFLGNFVLVPESVASVARDLIVTEDVLHTANKLVVAGVISSDDYKLIKENHALERERAKY